MTSATPAYVRLFHLLAAVRQMSPVDRLNPDEEALFESLVLLWHDRGRITVSDIMRSGEHGSQATAYRRLIALQEKGLVDLAVDRRDRRVKFVEPTAQSRKRIKFLQEGLDAILEESPGGQAA